MSLPLPLPDPPSAVVVAALDELRLARRELADARRIVHMVTVEPLEPGPRAVVETAVAKYRVALWREHVDRAVARCRQLGLDVAPQA